MKKKIFSVTYIAIGLIIGLSTLSAFADWTPPSHNPPNCPTGEPGCDAPLNVGPSHQTKLGSISINTTTDSPDPFGLDVFGISRFFGNVEIGTAASPATIKIVDGSTLTSGKVLTAIDNNGTAGWRVPTGGGSGDTGNVGVYTFTSSYYTLMQNSEFRTWFSSFTNGTALLKPLSGTGSSRTNDEGWTEWDARVTADKLCNFFTNGPSITYTVVGLGSDNNNYFYRWDRTTNAWQVNSSSWHNSRDISSVTCLANNGIIRGSALQTPPAAQGGTQCGVQTYRCRR